MYMLAATPPLGSAWFGFDWFFLGIIPLHKVIKPTRVYPSFLLSYKAGHMYIYKGKNPTTQTIYCL